MYLVDIGKLLFSIATITETTNRSFLALLKFYKD